MQRWGILAGEVSSNVLNTVSNKALFATLGVLIVLAGGLSVVVFGFWGKKMIHERTGTAAKTCESINVFGLQRLEVELRPLTASKLNDRELLVHHSKDEYLSFFEVQTGAGMIITSTYKDNIPAEVVGRFALKELIDSFSIGSTIKDSRLRLCVIATNNDGIRRSSFLEISI